MFGHQLKSIEFIRTRGTSNSFTTLNKLYRSKVELVCYTHRDFSFAKYICANEGKKELGHIPCSISETI